MKIDWKVTCRCAALLVAAAALSGCLTSGESADAIGPVNGGGSGGTGAGNSAPVLSGSPTLAVTAGQAYQFTPMAEDADNDPLTFSITNLPAWASFDVATGEVAGIPGMGDVGTYDGIEIVVSDGTASVTYGPFTVQVVSPGSSAGSAVLTWTAPLENESGTALTDLVGYTLYWGTSQGNYSNSVSIDNPGLTTYVVESLPAGVYEFVITARNSAGIESGYSNTATIAIN